MDADLARMALRVIEELKSQIARLEGQLAAARAAAEHPTGCRADLALAIREALGGFDVPEIAVLVIVEQLAEISEAARAFVVDRDDAAPPFDTSEWHALLRALGMGG